MPERNQARPRPQKAKKPTVPVAATAAPPAAERRGPEAETELRAFQAGFLEMLGEAHQQGMRAVVQAAAPRESAPAFAAVPSADQEAAVVRAVCALHRQNMAAADGIALGEMATRGLAAEIAGRIFLQTMTAAGRRSRPRRRGTDPRLMRVVDRGFDIIDMIVTGQPKR